MNSQLTTVWKLIPHHLDKEAALAWTKANKRIAIGWGFIGDINAKSYSSAKEITGDITKAYNDGTHPYKNAGEGGLTLWSFAKEMKVGDLVIVSGRAARQLVVRVIGDYQISTPINPMLANYDHQREVELTDISPDELWHLAGAKVIAGRSPYATLARCANQIDLADLNQ